MVHAALSGSLNQAAERLVEQLLVDASALRVTVQRLENDVRLIDAGVDCIGGLETGRRIAEICLGGLGRVTLTGNGPVDDWAVNVHVHCSDPVKACLGSQYAGWSLSHGEGSSAFQALGSGPARILAGKEKLYSELGMSETSNCATLVLEVDRQPPLALTQKIADDCGVAADRLTLILTPTRSLAGATQVAARVLEVALHKAHELGFALHDIVDGAGSAPLPPPASDFLEAMGRTNDAILFGGQVHLFVDGEDAAAESLARSLPSSASRDYGRPFADVFKAYDYDFFKVDPMLFSPARVSVTALRSGRSFRAGSLDRSLLQRSFGLSA